jgi:hypothetical protein
MQTFWLDQSDYQPLVALLILGQVCMNLAGYSGRRDQESGSTFGPFSRDHLLR